MELKEFISKFVEPNTLIRLWTKVDSGHNQLENPQMEWKLVKGEYANYIVIGVTDILVSGNYPEAVNIVVSSIENHIHNKIKDVIDE